MKRVYTVAQPFYAKSVEGEPQEQFPKLAKSSLTLAKPRGITYA